MENFDSIPSPEIIFSNLDSLYSKIIASISDYNQLIYKYEVENKEDMLRLLQPFVSILQEIDINFAFLDLKYPSEYLRFVSFKHDLAHYISPIELRITMLNTPNYEFRPEFVEKITMPLNKLKEFLVMSRPDGLILKATNLLSVHKNIRTFQERIPGLPNITLASCPREITLKTNPSALDSICFNLLKNTVNPNLNIKNLRIDYQFDPFKATHIQLIIEDDGPGIRPSLLLPKNSGNRALGGQGLGLPSVINLISEMDDHYINIMSISAEGKIIPFNKLKEVLEHKKPDETYHREKKVGEAGTIFSIGIPIIQTS